MADVTSIDKAMPMADLLKASLSRLMTWAARTDGQALTEYALVLALIALVTVLALALLGGQTTSALSTVARPI